MVSGLPLRTVTVSPYASDTSQSQPLAPARLARARSEEHTSELQSRPQLVCRLLLEKKKTGKDPNLPTRPWPVPPRGSASGHLRPIRQGSTTGRNAPLPVGRGAPIELRESTRNCPS